MQRMNQASVNHDVMLACMDPWGRSVDVPTTLGFHQEDPYAITLTFRAGSGDVIWLVARDIVLQGLTAPAGEGDIKVYPSIDDDAHAVTVLDFSSPDGRLVGQVPTRELQDFIAESMTVVPVGSEAQFLDLDGLAEALLGSAA
jgi:hypothetical protein